MIISVKLVGALRHAAKSEKINIECQEGWTLKQLVERIKMGSFEITQDLANPRLNTLILVNKTEMSALGGLETALQDKDEVTLIPVVHGG
jgi:molybdopterin converting factor small subunit